MRRIAVLFIALGLIGCGRSVETAQASGEDPRLTNPNLESIDYEKRIPAKVDRLDAKIDRLEKLIQSMASMQNQDRQALLIYSECDKKLIEWIDSRPRIQHYDKDGEETYKGLNDEDQKTQDEMYKQCQKLKPLTVAPTGC